MEKLRNVYFYIDTKAYVANAALKADPEVVGRFYQESREALWDIGFGTGKDWAQKGNEMLSIGVMAISGNIRAETIPELEQTLKNRRSFQYTRYNDYGNSFVLTKEEEEEYFQLLLEDYESAVVENFRLRYETWEKAWMDSPAARLPGDIVLCRGYDVEYLFLKRFPEIAAGMVDKGMLLQKQDGKQVLYSLPELQKCRSVPSTGGKGRCR